MIYIYLFILGRILIGGFFLKSGYNHFKNLSGMAGYAQSKGVPMPKQAVIVTGIMLALGGLGLILGAYVQFSISLLSVFLIITTFMMHRYWEDKDQMARMGNHVNFYKNLALLGGLLMLLSIPLPWAYSLFLF